MNGKWRLLVLAALLLWICIRTARAAFAAPWSWTHDQALLVWLVLCAALLLSVWVTVWLRGGNDAVGVRWKRTLERSAASMEGRKVWWNLFFWIGIAVALVFIITMTRH